jgi:Mn2+/Fe2+ NRAMP family transporter
MFAASAVGTSHIVQSTRAGAAFGLTSVAIVVAICLIKYPVFRFGAEYAAATGRSLVHGYAQRGRWLIVLLLLAVLIEGTGAIAGVGLVTSGIGQLLFGTGFDDKTATIAVVLATGLIVAAGRYNVVENITKVFVVFFTVLTVLSTLAAAPLLSGRSTLALPFAFDSANIDFTIAVSGWMPTGNVAAIMLAAWVLARSRDGARPFSASDTRWDFHVGYFTALVLAVCFVVLGTAVLLGSATELPTASVGFAALLMSVFGTVIGQWAEWFIAVTALAVMYSTLLAVVDGFPRLIRDIAANIGLFSAGVAESEACRLTSLALMMLTPCALLLFFLSSFGTFIDLVITTSFLVAPIVAIGNHLLITGAEVAPEHRPKLWLRMFSLLSIALLTTASLAFVTQKLFA